MEDAWLDRRRTRRKAAAKRRAGVRGARIVPGASRSDPVRRQGPKSVLPLLVTVLLASGAALADDGDATGDRDALMALHVSAGGVSWFDDTNWGSSKRLGDWYGVRTDADGRVTGLDLANNNLMGTLPGQLGDLGMLESLTMRDNRLTGSLPTEFGDLTRLVRLDLSGNDLDEPLPAEIGRLDRLAYLILSSNRLPGAIPDALAGLAALRELDLRSNALSGTIPAGLGERRSLVRLDLSGNALFGEIPATLGNLEALQSLNLSENRLGGFIPAELAAMAQLRELNLSSNLLRGEIPAELGALAALEVLVLSDNALTGELPRELGNLSELWWLAVGTNFLEGEIPEWSADLDKLLILTLGYNRFTGQIPGGLGYLPDITNLTLEDNLLTGGIPSELGHARSLTFLTLGGNRLTGKLPSSLANLERLWTLDLGSMEVCIADDVELKRWLGGIRVVWGHAPNCPNPDPVYLVQSVQSLETPVPLVAGRAALLRVFLASAEAAGMEIPAVEATFHNASGEEVHRVEIAAGGTIAENITEGSLDASANARIPGRVIRSGVELTVEVRGDLPGLPTRIPATGRIVLDVVDVPPLDLTLVPLQTPDDPHSAEPFVDAVVEQGAKHPALRRILDYLPVRGVSLTAHEPVATSSADPYEMLRLVTAIRAMEAGSGYWQGVPGPAVRSKGHGLGWLNAWTSVADPDGRTMAHELGHNMTLTHAPCGEPPGMDPYYPHPGARIGSWGYNRRYGTLVPPTAHDSMSYCHPTWTSEYSLSRALRHRVFREVPDRVEEAQSPRTEPTLLLWGGVESGAPYLRPSFLVDAVAILPPPGDDYVISGRTADGQAFSLKFDMPPLADAHDETGAFVITLPVTWNGRLESIRLAAGDRATDLDLGSSEPMTILRDLRTGQVRAIVDGPAVEAMGRIPDAPVEVLESFGAATR